MNRDKLLNYLPIILLLVPLMHLAGKAVVDTHQLLKPSPEVWRDKLERIRRNDAPYATTQHSVVVAGGRQVVHWTGLEETLAPLPVVNRGVGSATVDDLTYLIEALLEDLKPRIVVLLPDRSNFHLRQNKRPIELLNDIQEFTQQVMTNDSIAHIYLYPPLNLPAQPQYYQRTKELTEKLISWANTQPHITVLRGNSLLARVNKQPNPRYFHSNGTQLNNQGYLILSFILRQQIKQDFPNWFE
ncbi:MAG: hypothetical protein CSA53_03430 [Gammaproteobacteria bacterium]|nr:MAG: hypothetical protein CSA53_03430 [Gammaproteobacteria bacterium]